MKNNRKTVLILIALLIVGSAFRILVPPKYDFWETTNGTTTHQTRNGTCAGWLAAHPGVNTSNIKCCDIENDKWTGEGINCDKGGGGRGTGGHVGIYPIGNSALGETANGYLTAVDNNGVDTPSIELYNFNSLMTNGEYAIHVVPDELNHIIHVYISDVVADSPYYNVLSNTHLSYTESYLNYAIHPDQAITVAPNPFTTEIIVNFVNLDLNLYGPLRIELYNSQNVLQVGYNNVTGTGLIIPRGILPNGAYYIKVFSSSSELIDTEIVIAQ